MDQTERQYKSAIKGIRSEISSKHAAITVLSCFLSGAHDMLKQTILTFDFYLVVKDPSEPYF